MNSVQAGNSKIREAMALSTQHPDYDLLPESIKLVHSAQEYLWLGNERLIAVERECNPDFDVTE